MLKYGLLYASRIAQNIFFEIFVKIRDSLNYNVIY